MIVVDDLLLFEVLSGTESEPFAELASAGIATTFSWYYRLSRALAAGRIDGSLSRRFAALSDKRRRYVHGLLDDLPHEIEMLHPRELVPLMSALGALASLNFLTAEAVAAAMILEASLVVSTSSTLLGNAAAVAGVELSVWPAA